MNTLLLKDSDRVDLYNSHIKLNKSSKILKRKESLIQNFLDLVFEDETIKNFIFNLRDSDSEILRQYKIKFLKGQYDPRSFNIMFYSPLNKTLRKNLKKYKSFDKKEKTFIANDLTKSRSYQVEFRFYYLKGGIVGMGNIMTSSNYTFYIPKDDFHKDKEILRKYIKKWVFNEMMR
jgi:hypothetical protein